MLDRQLNERSRSLHEWRLSLLVLFSYYSYRGKSVRAISLCITEHRHITDVGRAFMHALRLGGDGIVGYAMSPLIVFPGLTRDPWGFDA